jgi:hypothetical protein
MNDLLDFILDAHGGLERWLGVSTLTAKLAVGGPFWGQLGFPDAFLDETLTIDTHRQHAVFTPWTAPGQSLTFDTDPERVVLQTADGQTVDSRTSPRFSYARHDLNSPWDALQVGYFLSYGMWNYLTTPFLLTYPAVQTRETTSWQENDQTWRRLHATFPPEITTHSVEQVFYFGDDGQLRRVWTTPSRPTAAGPRTTPRATRPSTNWPSPPAARSTAATPTAPPTAA